MFNVEYQFIICIAIINSVALGIKKNITNIKKRGSRLPTE